MKHIIIVQNRRTQFDVPLYNLIAEKKPFKLTVIYSESSSTDAIDNEIGIPPNWDHISNETYARIDLSARDSKDAVRVADKITSLCPDLIIISGYYPPLHRRLAKKLLNKGMRVGLRSDNTVWHSDFKGLRGLLKKLVLPHLFASYSSWHPVGSMAEEYLNTLSRKKRPSFSFPYNVDNQWLLEQANRFRQSSDQIRESMGILKSDYVVLGVLKWSMREDPLTLIRGFKHFQTRYNGAKLILVGDGPLRNEVETEVADLFENIVLPGYVSYSQLPKYYAISNVFVHPAKSEPWGCSVNEALACGVPAIVSEGVGSRADLIVSGDTGYVFNNGNAAMLGDQLELVRAKRDSMTAACKEIVSKWSYDSSIRSMQNALNEII